MMRIHRSLALVGTLALLAGCASEDGSSAASTSNISATDNAFTTSIKPLAELAKTQTMSVFGIVEPSLVLKRTDAGFAPYFGDCDNDACLRGLSVRDALVRDLSTLGVFVEKGLSVRTPDWTFSPTGTGLMFRRATATDQTADTFTINADDLGDGTKAVALPKALRTTWASDDLLVQQIDATKVHVIDATKHETKLELTIGDADVVRSADGKSFLVYSSTSAKLIRATDLKVLDVASWDMPGSDTSPNVIAAPNGHGFAVARPASDKGDAFSVSYVESDGGTMTVLEANATGDIAFASDSRLAWVKPGAAATDPSTIVVRDPAMKAPAADVTITGVPKHDLWSGLRFSADGKFVEIGWRFPATHAVADASASSVMHPIAPAKLIPSGLALGDAVLLADHLHSVVAIQGKDATLATTMPTLYVVDIAKGESKQIGTFPAGKPASILVDDNATTPVVAATTADGPLKLITLEGKVVATLPEAKASLAWKDGWLYYSTSAINAAPPATGRAIHAISSDGLATGSVSEHANEVVLDFATTAGIADLQAPNGATLTHMFLRNGADVVTFSPPKYVASAQPATPVAPIDNGDQDPTTPTKKKATPISGATTVTTASSSTTSSAADDSGGCSTTHGSRGPGGAVLLALFGLVLVRKRREG